VPEREELVVVGCITRPQALGGRFRVQAEVDDPAVFRSGRPLWTGPPGAPLERLEVEEVEVRPKGLLFKVKGIDTVEQVEKYRGQLLYMEPGDLPELPEDSFYYYELVGCQVVLPDGSVIGRVKEVQPGAMGDLIVVRQGEEETLIPAAKEFVKSVDLAHGLIRVDLPEGLR